MDLDTSQQLQPNSAASQDPLVVAVFAPHPDLVDQVREASWAARERRAKLHLIVRRDGHVNERLQGAPDEPAVRQIAERYRATCESHADVSNLKSRLEDIVTQHNPVLVVHGAQHRFPWSLGLNDDEVQIVHSLARDHGIAVVEAQSPASDQHLKWTLPAWRLDRRRPWFHDYVLSAFAVSLAAILVKWLDLIVPPESLAAVFLTAIVYSASAYGFSAALFASTFSIAIYDFFFLDPRFSISVGEPETVLLFLVFLVVAAITSNLAGGLRAQARRSERQATEARALFELTRDIAVAKERSGIFQAIVHRIEDVFESTCILLAPDKSAPASGDGMKSRTASLQIEYPPDSSLSRDEIEAARTAFLSGKPLGRGTQNQPDLDYYFHPLMTSDETVAVLALRKIPADNVRAPDFRALIGSICRIAGIAVERTLRARELENARVLSQTEGLRSALLSSISHDFGTPLASIIGSASSLISYGKTYTPEVTHELLQTIMEEAERLNRFVKNVLQMNKLESGALVPQMQWADVGDLISTALDASHRRLQNHEIYVDVGDRLPLAQVDFVLMETVIVNLLDNAAKYSAAESAIQVTARANDTDITIDVTDQGRGIAPEELGAVFDKFYRAKHRDRTVPGTGLGLAICRGIVESHGGTVEALSQGLGHGTTIRIRLPVRTPDAAATAEI